MPKTRGGDNSIGSRSGSSRRGIGSGAGGGVGAGGVNEMSDRIDNRLGENNEVDVSVFSTTRGQNENVTVVFDSSQPNIASVRSASGNTYTVDSSGDEPICTCGENRFRGGRCRHIEAVSIAQQQTARGTAVGSQTDHQINTAQTLNENIEYERREESRNASREFTDDNHFYSDDISAMESEMNRLRSTQLPYYYDNVLNGSDITFGIELEFQHGDSNAIARELHERGICAYDRMVEYHSPGVSGKWKLERDGSVTNGSRGGELVSPILKDTPETWRQIETICEVVKRHGGVATVNTGGHVHVSVEPLDGKRQRWRRLFKAFGNNEETILRFAGGELGQLRSGAEHYARSSVRDMENLTRSRLPQEGTIDDYARGIRAANTADRYRTINLIPLGRRQRDCVEIRAFNGCLNPSIIQANVKVSAGLIHTSERSRIQGDDAAPTTESFKRRGEMINTRNSERHSNNSIAKFLDTYFTRKEDKEHVLAVIARNRWAD